jgi:hypothetical protein
MCEEVGLSVVRLRRNRYGFLNLAGLKPGEFRELTAEEAQRLAVDPRSAAPQPKPQLAKASSGHRTGERDGKKTGHPAPCHQRQRPCRDARKKD